MPKNATNENRIREACHALVRAFLSGGPASVAAARAELTAALAAYDAA